MQSILSSYSTYSFLLWIIIANFQIIYPIKSNNINIRILDKIMKTWSIISFFIHCYMNYHIFYISIIWTFILKLLIFIDEELSDKLENSNPF